MKRLSVALLAACVAAGSVQAAPPVHHAAPRHVDWTHVVAYTPEGGVRMGNPDARVKLVEYFSFTCPHCAAFSAEAYGPIAQKYVATGQLSLELRSALRDALDMVAALSARCAPPPAYFATVEDIMADQSDWVQKASDWIPDHRDDLNGPKKPVALVQLAQQMGLQAILAKHGVAPARLGVCLNDAKTQKTLETTTNDAWNVRHIGGTPGFLVNDQLQDGVYVWDALEPKIQAALKS